jgi:long-chain acyl-CoA synthetase
MKTASRLPAMITSPIFKKFKSVVERRTAHTAVIYLGTAFSYSRVAEMSERFAAALFELGISKGCRIILYIPNGIQWIVVWLGIQRAGAVAVPITPIYTPHDLKYIAEDTGAGAVVCADTNFGYVQKVLDQSNMGQVIVVKMTDLLPWWKRWFGTIFDVVPKGTVKYDRRTHSFRKMLSRHGTLGAGKSARSPAGGNPCEILYTGGTTRHPKGVPISTELFLISADEQIRVSEPLFAAEKNVILCNAPLFHILGQTCGLATLLVGGTLIVQPRLNLDATFDAIQRFGVKTMIGVPTLYRMILEHNRLDQYDLSSIDYWYSAGDVLPVEVGNRWKKRFGKPIFQGYGATETCGGVSMCPTHIDNPPRSVGRIVASKTVMIVDPATLKPVGTGETGELLVSSAPMVDRYLNKPDETRQAFVELEDRRWYRTADIMAMDERGNLFFVDRTADTIKHKGYRISASEVESVLQEHPAVISACVVGVPDDSVGERIKAYVVLKADTRGITGYELVKWCREKMVAYKVPQYIEFRDMLPKSKVGKLLRREIREEEQRRKET